MQAKLFSVVLVAWFASLAHADPCGMVPPIYDGEGLPITRIGEQKTYVFFQDGIETFVIRPEFRGNVDEFGMLIPFPTPPALRKVPDNIFAHIAAAVDPPEIIVDLRPSMDPFAYDGAVPNTAQAPGLQFDEPTEAPVRVIKQEAVGMYEVAVLAAGSAQGLQRWMDDHGYKYPDGMDEACEDYVKLGWCFVVVKTKVGQKGGVDPQPGQRDVKAALPAGSSFDGNVQGMGFRFHSKELVVPMRLSAFNEGELHNIVYLLTDNPSKIRSIPEEHVRRQVRGNVLYRNVTAPLPLRIIGGTEKDIPDWRQRSLSRERDPVPHNGMARELFAGDLLAVKSGELSLPHEEQEKVLLRIGERFGLRGKEIDAMNVQVLSESREQVVKEAVEDLLTMTLTVVDGDFPRQVLAKENLTFTSYEMPAEQNTPRVYNAIMMDSAPEKSGVVLVAAPRDVLAAAPPDVVGPVATADPQASTGSAPSSLIISCIVGLFLVTLVFGGWILSSRGRS